MANPSFEIANGRATLKFLRRDINQICSLGGKLVGGQEPQLLGSFKAMFSGLAPLRQEYMTKFESCQFIAIVNKIVDEFPNDEDTKQRNEVNCLYYKCIEHNQTLSPALGNDNTSICNKSSARNILPKISIPRWSGTLSEWPQFKQLFLSLVHDNQDIGAAEKFYHLRTSLLGDPLGLIAAFSLDEKNYTNAWKALLDRYDNQRLLAASYVDKVLDFSPDQRSPTLSSLQSFERVVAENVSALRTMQLKNEGDFLWLTISLRKLDPVTRRQFETQHVGKEWPVFSELVDFVKDKCKILQLSGDVSNVSCKQDDSRSSRFSKSSDRSQILNTTIRSNYVSPTPKSNCCTCKRTHPLYHCPTFRDKSPHRRKAFLKGKNVCFNCLRPGHFVSSCGSMSRCRTCNAKHHTLLHGSIGSTVQQTSARTTPQGEVEAHVVSPRHSTQASVIGPQNAVICNITNPAQVLLGTAEVLAHNCEGIPTPTRLVIDCGSQLSLITSSCAKRLGLVWKATKRSPLGVGQTPMSNVKGRLSYRLQSRLHPEYSMNIEALVVTTISVDLPTAQLPSALAEQFPPDALADPMFWRPRPVEILVGNDLFMKIVTGAPILLTEDYGALPTKFGLIMMGNLGELVDASSPAQCLCISDVPISNDLVSRFWEQEEVSQMDDSSVHDPCEAHFVATHYREDNGRYVVYLPFKEPAIGLEESNALALHRLRSLEVRFSKDPILERQYRDFMTEYESLGHTSPTNAPSAYVIPHHAVFRSAPEPKIRVVFDASFPTRNGSLNDKLHSGRKLQKDICDIIINFRRHKIAITADLVKMYRQILVAPEHRSYQHILWRRDSREPYGTFELNTLTYGTAPAAFLAIRTLLQLADDEGNPHPRAAAVLREEIYVDDVVSGAASLEEALELKQQLSDLLKKGNFTIHKWASNSKDFLRHLESSEPSTALALSLEDSCVTKVLGLAWDPSHDQFFFQVGRIISKVSKRTILSTISCLYDPLGFLAPVIFRAKCIMQMLWQDKVNWDDSPDPLITRKWITFANQLPSVSSIKIPRYIFSGSLKETQIIGFSDASQKGFAAVLYLRTVASDGLVKVYLLKSKTKLAPLKVVTIPRLELMGAHLLTKLFCSIKPFVQSQKLVEQIFFTDSTIVLAWLKCSPHNLQTFVANRVTQVISHTSTSQWYHVTSANNPTDVASRGLMPSELESNTLWWNGPEFLYQVPLPLSIPEDENSDVPELRRGVTLMIENHEPFLVSWIENHSNFQKMIRVFAMIRRFISNLRSSPELRSMGSLTVQEFSDAKRSCILAVQQQYFQGEFDYESSRPISKRLMILAATVDADGILRVGGRLQNSNVPEYTKSPIILDGRSHFVKIMIDHFHRVHFHMGAQAILSFLRQHYWIFRLRQTIRSRISKCLTCFRSKAKPLPPLMGNLPSDRVQSSHSFAIAGVDFAGPFPIKLGTRRNSPIGKSYLCIFVCMSSKAVHLEVVSDLTTDAFLAALDRFISRRGIPRTIRSDCGTNFVGAQRRLKELNVWWNKQKNQDVIHRHAADLQITWIFNPPYSPHFGGMWEAAVKSAKNHLRRTVGDRPLKFEELNTLFSRIEAIMNSRPIGPLNDDPAHGDFLTPGHLLIGRPLLATPEPDIKEVPLNRLSRWQLVRHCLQSFWKRWHVEYLHTLKRRPKWYKSNIPLKVEDLVLLSDPGSQPMLWKMVRVVECHPGGDFITRVVTLKDSRGCFKRSVHQLVSLAHICSNSSY